MSKLISIEEMRTIAANMDDQGDHRYSHREVRRLLKEQKELTLKEVAGWLDNFVKEGGIVPHILLEALKKGEMPG